VVDFFAAYDALLERWPVNRSSIDVASAYGTTRVVACGPEEGSPLVLLSTWRATATIWYANVSDLARTHRVFAVDHMGRSAFDGKPFSSVDDLMAWLDGLLDGLGLESTALCGHSYGSWLALNYALHAPERISRLALLDPTDCFSTLRLGYRLHAVPLMLGPNGRRVRAFLTWETGGRLDPDWLTVTALESERPGPKLVWPRRPAPERFAGFAVPTLVVLAEHSKAIDIRQTAAAARRLIPGVEVVELPGATHHSIPMIDAGPLNRSLLEFLG
jgi:pimeloyl-ACP methyl ester carboxylesterase